MSGNFIYGQRNSNWTSVNLKCRKVHIKKSSISTIRIKSFSFRKRRFTKLLSWQWSGCIMRELRTDTDWQIIIVIEPATRKKVERITTTDEREPEPEKCFSEKGKTGISVHIRVKLPFDVFYICCHILICCCSGSGSIVETKLSIHEWVLANVSKVCGAECFTNPNVEWLRPQKFPFETTTRQDCLLWKCCRYTLLCLLICKKM